VKTATELQSKLVFSTNLEIIRSNRQPINSARAAVQAELDVVNALAKANKQLCKHPNRRTYNDPRDPGGWDCSDCGGGG